MMQLFISEFEIHGDTIILNNKEVLEQIRKVLRGKIGDICFFQNLEGERYKVELLRRDKHTLEASILSKLQGMIEKKNKVGTTTMIVAIPNKWSKAELIVQKLTEIGIDTIYFWPAERSVIKKENENKIKRIHAIAREADEQSWRRSLPTITFFNTTQDLKSYLSKKKVMVFDLPSQDNLSTNDFTYNCQSDCIGIVGPEGGLTSKDYASFGEDYLIQHLGSSVLRMETAAIIGAREIQKLELNR